MRNEAKYFKLLNSWAKELEITGKVLKMEQRQHGIYVVLLGGAKELAEFVSRWKTQNVDVDSRGRHCKEKMITFLLHNHQLKVTAADPKR